MKPALKIDFVSDVSCPWCAVGLGALQAAIAELGDEVAVELRFQPFELNPAMAREGEDVIEHIAAKYGSTPAQIAQSQQAITQRGAEVGFTFNLDKRQRIYNTFDAHRLLHWAEGEGRQLALKEALLKAYFTDGANPSDHAVLLEVATEVGLDAARAAELLSSDEYATEVRQREEFYQRNGVHAVPSVIINEQHLIQGGQPASVFAQALRQIAAQ